MYVPPSTLDSSGFLLGDTASGGALQGASQQDVEFLAQIRGSPQTEKLLCSLAQTLIYVKQGKSNSVDAQKGSSVQTTQLGSEGKEKLFFQKDIKSTCFDGDCVIQEAFLDDLCSYLSSGAVSLEKHQDTAVLAPPPFQISMCSCGKRQEIRAMLTQLAESSYWRRALLIPLLRRWLQEGNYSFFASLLLQIVTDMIGRRLLSSSAINLHNKVGCDSTAGDVKMSAERHEDNMKAMRELEDLIKATNSFRGLCIGIDAIIRNNILCLIEHVNSVFSRDNFKNESRETLTGFTRVEVERVVDTSTRSTWKNIFEFLSRCVTDVQIVFSESLWMFLMTLLSGYTGTFQLVELRPATINVATSVVELHAQRIFVENMRRDLLNYLTVRLSKDRVASGKSLITMQNVLCCQPFFWVATMEVELAPELLPHALLSQPDVKLWARGLAANAWGTALRLVQVLVHGQDAVEEIPALAEGADLVTLTIRQRQRQLLEEYVERLASLLLERFGENPHLSAMATSTGEENLSFAVVWSTYMGEFFLRTYHSTCFTILSLEEQDSLVDLLRQLHALLANEGREAVGVSITQLLESYVDSSVGELQEQDKKKAEKALLGWHASCVHSRVVHALKDDSLLIMCLLRALFVLFDRIGKTNLNVHDVLRNTFLPVLALLCINRVDCGVENNDNGDDVDENDDAYFEEYYESQQGIMMLLASGFFALPWDIQGVQVRLLLYKVIGESLYDCFSAEEAFSEVDNLFALYTGDSQALENIASFLGVNMSNATFVQWMTSEGEGTSTVADIIDGFLRCEAPVQFPAPCGALLLMSVFRTLSLRLLQLRAEWEQQLRLLGDDTQYYLGRQATFCTTRDIDVFRILVQLAHHMVLGFQLQSFGLLRMWLSYLNHLFTNIVPPLTEDDEIVFFAPSKNQDEYKSVDNFRRCEYRRSQNETSQGELRVALGELLADLAVMPLVESDAAMRCPAALPQRPGGEKWRRQQNQRMQDVLVLQRVLPTLVLEEMCFALRVSTDCVNKDGPSPTALRLAGNALDQSFLGLLGVAVFCRRFELFVVPESFADQRCAALLQFLWSAVEANSVMATT